MTEPETPDFVDFLFPTTTQVLWAEEVALEGGVPVEIVPAPAGHKKLCGLALRTFKKRGPEVERLLEEEGIPFLRVWS